MPSSSPNPPTPKHHINLPGFGTLHVLAFVLILAVVGVFVFAVVFAVVQAALNPPTPEEKAERAAQRAEEQAAEDAKKRKDAGYLDDPEYKETAKAAIKSIGYSCPDVHGVRALGDRGRGQVLRIQCTNNVFFLMTILPGDRGYTVEIDD